MAKKKNSVLRVLLIISFLGMLTSCIQVYENNISSKPQDISSMFTVATPTFNITQGLVQYGVEVIISCNTQGSSIYYTLDGSIPSKESFLYSNPITITKQTTIKAVAVKEGYNDSEVVSTTYTIIETVDLPVFSLNGSVFCNTEITISSSTQDAVIYYTTDGTEPTINSTIFDASSPIIITQPITIKAIAVKEGMNNSDVAFATYTITTLPTYTISYESAYGVKPQNISVTEGYILSDKDLPLLTESGWTFCGWNKNVGDVVNMDITITATWTEWETVAIPVITPESGEVSTETTATISCNTNEATIYFTTDGSTPSTSSYIYSEPIPVISNMTIKAFAVKNNMKDSQVVSSSYTVPVVNNPMFNTISNVISPKTIVFITCTTPNAIIYYTTNGENPTNFSTQYNKESGIVISRNTTIKAIAIKSGMLNSEVVQKTYTTKTTNGELQGTPENNQYQGKVLISQSSTGIKTDENGNLHIPVTNEPKTTVVIPFTEEVVAIPKGTQAVISIMEDTAVCNSYQFSSNRKVKLSPFYISKYPVTRALYKAVMESNHPSDNYPVYSINWFDAIVFCNKLSIKMGLEPVYSYYGKTNPDDWFVNTRDLSSSIPTQYNNVYDYIHYDNWKDKVIIDLTKNGYRLPTSAEWEYAARGGDPNAEDWLYTYSGSNDIEEVAWYKNNSDGIIHEVGTRKKDINTNVKPNKLGLFDMSGNIFEWCNDTTATNPIYPNTEGYFVNPMVTGISYCRILRGGSYNKESNYCGVISGTSEQPAFSYQNFGLRLVRTAN